MSPFQKRSFEALYDRYSIPVHHSTKNPEDFFPNPGPVYLEIGFGMGEATLDIAGRFPDSNFLGIEVHTPGVGKLLGSMDRKGITNIRVVKHDALDVLQYTVPPDSLAGVHIFFPDPWPKKRHHKRRLFRAGFTELVSSRIQSGGYLYVVTDWEEYAEEILSFCEQCDVLRNTTHGFAPRQPWRPETSFEKKGHCKNHIIREIFFRKK
jgi:tRNA (guanine-N7-)-methyltransferase